MAFDAFFKKYTLVYIVGALAQQIIFSVVFIQESTWLIVLGFFAHNSVGILSRSLLLWKRLGKNFHSSKITCFCPPLALALQCSLRQQVLLPHSHQPDMAIEHIFECSIGF